MTGRTERVQDRQNRADGLVAAARRRAFTLVSPGSGWAVGAVLLGCAALVPVLGALAVDRGFGLLLGLPWLLLVGHGLGVRRARAEQSALLLAQQERLRVARRWGTTLDERARTADEIHDGLAHSLGALGLQLQLARALLASRPEQERALNAVVTAQRLTADAVAGTHQAIEALNSDPLPLAEQLAALCGAHGRAHRVAADFSARGRAGTPAPKAVVALLHTARQALTGAAEHAPGRAVSVRLDHREDRVRLTVVNEAPAGANTAAAAPLGHGLTTARERLELLDGSLNAGYRQGRWVVTADIPLDGAGLPATRPRRFGHPGRPQAGRAA
ncbi:sensor histidine kinase [Kitasatospora sp. NPDC101176]|uniref:sensor histidine kinase n=1 Tax=Kitasatospora sp. NPDC101176 TaxID=3364099 RepID=UPI00380A3E55